MFNQSPLIEFIVIVVDSNNLEIMPASDNIPTIARPFVSERAKKTLDLVSEWVKEEKRN